jgi:hypothetical protein
MRLDYQTANVPQELLLVRGVTVVMVTMTVAVVVTAVARLAMVIVPGLIGSSTRFASDFGSFAFLSFIVGVVVQLIGAIIVWTAAPRGFAGGGVGRLRTGLLVFSVGLIAGAVGGIVGDALRMPIRQQVNDLLYLGWRLISSLQLPAIALAGFLVLKRLR